MIKKYLFAVPILLFATILISSSPHELVASPQDSEEYDLPLAHITPEPHLAASSATLAMAGVISKNAYMPRKGLLSLFQKASSRWIALTTLAGLITWQWFGKKTLIEELLPQGKTSALSSEVPVWLSSEESLSNNPKAQQIPLTSQNSKNLDHNHHPLLPPLLAKEENSLPSSNKKSNFYMVQQELEELKILYEELSYNEWLMRIRPHLSHHITINEIQPLELLSDLYDHFKKTEDSTKTTEYMALKSQYIFLTIVMNLGTTTHAEITRKLYIKSMSSLLHIRHKIKGYLKKYPYPKINLQDTNPQDSFTKIAALDLTPFKKGYRSLREDQIIPPLYRYLHPSARKNLDPEALLHFVEKKFSIEQKIVFFSYVLKIGDLPNEYITQRYNKTPQWLSYKKKNIAQKLSGFRLTNSPLEAKKPLFDPHVKPQVDLQNTTLSNLLDLDVKNLKQNYRNLTKEQLNLLLHKYLHHSVRNRLDPEALLHYVEEKLGIEKQLVFFAHILKLSNLSIQELAQKHNRELKWIHDQRNRIIPQLLRFRLKEPSPTVPHPQNAQPPVKAPRTQTTSTHFPLESWSHTRQNSLLAKFHIHPESAADFFAILKALAENYKKHNQNHELSLLYDPILNIAPSPSKNVETLSTSEANEVLQDVLSATDLLTKRFSSLEELQKHQHQMISRLSSDEWNLTPMNHRPSDISKMVLSKKLTSFLHNNTLTEDPKNKVLLYYALAVPKIKEAHLSELLELSVEEIRQKARSFYRDWLTSERLISTHPQKLETLEEHLYKLSSVPLHKLKKELVGSQKLSTNLAHLLQDFYHNLPGELERHVFLSLVLKLEQPTKTLYHNLAVLYGLTSHHAISSLKAKHGTLLTALVDFLKKNLIIHKQTQKLSENLNDPYYQALRLDIERNLNRALKNPISLAHAWQVSEQNIDDFKLILSSFSEKLQTQNPYLWCVFMIKVLKLDEISYKELQKVFSEPSLKPYLSRENETVIEEKLTESFKDSLKNISENPQNSHVSLNHERRENFFRSLHDLWIHLLPQHLDDHLRMMTTLNSESTKTLYSAHEISKISKQDIDDFLQTLTAEERSIFWSLILKIGELGTLNIMEIAEIYEMDSLDIAHLRDQIKKNFIAHMKQKL